MLSSFAKEGESVPMLSFGFADRTLDIEEMEETRELKKGESVTYANTFNIF